MSKESENIITGSFSYLVEYPEYYEEFHCIADQCPDTCCAGWEVDLDDEAWYRYLVVRGAFGDKLRRHMREDGAWKYFPLDKRGRCPFLKEDNLCEIYEVLGEDALCRTCAEHPRYFIGCGDYEQRDMSLGCPEVARIFFTHEGPIRYCRKIGRGEDEEGRQETDRKETSLPGAENSRKAVSAGETAKEGIVLSGSSSCIDGIYEQYADARLQAILTDRNRILHILQGGEQRGGEEVTCRDRQPGGGEVTCRASQQGSREMTCRARLQAAGIWQQVDDHKLMELVHRMEPLNADWEQRVTGMERLILGNQVQKKPSANEGAPAHEENQAQPAIHPAENNTAAHIPASWLVRFACYLVFRYWIDAYYDDTGAVEAGGIYDPGPQIRLVNRSIRLLELLYASDMAAAEPSVFTGMGGADTCLERMIRVAHIFSRQVEFDEENVALMKEL